MVRGGDAPEVFVVRGALPDVALTIDGGAGRDILIAGASGATLNGGAGEDILIAGTTDYDTNDTALLAIMSEWTRTDEDYATRAQAKSSIFEYLEVFYNRERRHSTLGYQSPADYEASRTG